MDLLGVLGTVNGKGVAIDRGTLVTILVLLAIVVLFIILFGRLKWWR